MGKVLKTTDGGSTWAPININSAPCLFSIWFTNAQNGIAVGYRGTIAKTTIDNSVTTYDNETIIPYPNPSNTTIHFPIINSSNNSSTLGIFDISGKLIEQKLITEGTEEVVLDLKSYKKGIYFFRINEHSGKFIVN